MKAERASIRYAKALLEFAIENQNEKAVLGEMQNILSIMESLPELYEALNSPILTSSQKRKIINEVFINASKMLNSLFDLLSQNGREGILRGVANQYIDLFDKNQGKVSATVTTAVPITEDLEKKVDAIIDSTISEKMTVISGIPPWVKMYFDCRIFY